MAPKTEKYRKYYLKCSNTFFADCNSNIQIQIQRQDFNLLKMLLKNSGYIIYLNLNKVKIEKYNKINKNKIINKYIKIIE